MPGWLWKSHEFEIDNRAIFRYAYAWIEQG